VKRLFIFLVLALSGYMLPAQHLHVAFRTDHPGRAMTVMVSSPDGQSVVAGDASGGLYIYRKESGREIVHWEGHKTGIRSIAFNSTGKLMLTASPGELRIWSLPERTLLHQLTDPRYEDIRFALFSIADGFIYFSSGSRLYKTRSDLQKQVSLIVDFPDPLTSAVISDDRAALVVASGSAVRVLNTRSDAFIQQLEDSRAFVESLAWIPGERLASWSADGTVLVRAYALGMLSAVPVTRFKAGSSSPMAFSADGRLMVSGRIGTWARVWDWPKHDIVQELFGHKGVVTGMVFDGNDRLLTCGADGAVILWTSQEEQPPAVLQPESPVQAPPAQAPPPQAEVAFDSLNIPLLVKGRPVTQSDTFRIGKAELEIFVYDNLAIDGDTISINLNGEWLLRDYGVQRQKKRMVIQLKPGNNSLVLYAENLGTSPPNTAAVEFEVNNRRRIVRLHSDLHSCSALNFIY
jgi:WD40 repeat protein